MSRLAETKPAVGEPAFRHPEEFTEPTKHTERSTPAGSPQAGAETGAQRITLLMPRLLWRRLKTTADEGPVADRVPLSETVRLLVQLWATDPDIQDRVAELHRQGDQVRRKGPEPRWG